MATTYYSGVDNSMTIHHPLDGKSDELSFTGLAEVAYDDWKIKHRTFYTFKYPNLGVLEIDEIIKRQWINLDPIYRDNIMRLIIQCIINTRIINSHNYTYHFKTY